MHAEWWEASSECNSPNTHPLQWHSPEGVFACIGNAAASVGDLEVRKAIQRYLVEWALAGPTKETGAPSLLFDDGA